MPRRKTSESNIRKLGRIGKASNASYYITLPINVVRDFDWREGQKLEVKRHRSKNRISIENWQP